jgi:hypothetical protein
MYWSMWIRCLSYGRRSLPYPTNVSAMQSNKNCVQKKPRSFCVYRSKRLDHQCGNILPRCEIPGRAKRLFTRPGPLESRPGSGMSDCIAQAKRADVCSYVAKLPDLRMSAPASTSYRTSCTGTPIATPSAFASLIRAMIFPSLEPKTRPTSHATAHRRVARRRRRSVWHRPPRSILSLPSTDTEWRERPNYT